MRSILLSLTFVAGLASAAAADVTVIDRGVMRRPAVVVTSAQDHAVFLAGRGAFHHSSCGQCEGIGTGDTPQRARENCCFYGTRKIRDEGVAWSPIRRRWIAVIRYQ
jgi:hypothetical protein